MRHYSFIDWAKTLGIFSVVCAHFFPSGSSERIFFYSFHVPLFFIISGFLWKEWNQISKKYVWKLTCRLLLPYSTWFALSIIPQVLMGETSLLFYIEKFFFISGTTIWNSALWFIPCFFAVSILHTWLCGFAKGDLVKHLMGAISFLGIAILFDRLEVIECIFGLNKVAFLLGIQFIGSATKLIYEKRNTINEKLCRHAIFVFVLIGVLSCRVNKGNNISIMNLDYNNIFLYVLVSVGMALSMMCFCRVLPACRFASVIANNTIPIMCGHLFFRLILNYTLPEEGIIYRISGIWIFALFSLAIYIVTFFSDRSQWIKKTARVFGFRT